MHRHIRVSQYINNLICDPTLDNHTCSLVKCCHFRRVSWSRIQRSSVHLQIAAQRSPSTCRDKINTDTHIDPAQSPRAWYPQAFESLELEKLFLRITVFCTETSDVTPAICRFLLFVKHLYVRLVKPALHFQVSMPFIQCSLLLYFIHHLSNLFFVKDVFNASFYISVLIFFGSQQPLPLIQAVVWHGCARLIHK